MRGTNRTYQLHENEIRNILTLAHYCPGFIIHLIFSASMMSYLNFILLQVSEIIGENGCDNILIFRFD